MITRAVNQDCIPSRGEFLADVIGGLSQTPKSLPCKYLYDHIGSNLFERICRTPEYYLTRTELEILLGAMDEIARIAGDHRLIVEYGSGSAVKTGFLLSHLKAPSAYIPIDIYPKYLKQTVRSFSQSFPSLEILPVCADFARPFNVPHPKTAHKAKLIFFPGSTIGNFAPSQALDLLRRMFVSSRPGDLVLVGVDLKKARHILHKAYNDAEGQTAAFNLNLLRRINRELGADFVIQNFTHNAFYNESAGRVEMHLVSAADQKVTLDGRQFHFDRGESIHTESSYKYSLDEFETLSRLSGFSIKRVWTDKKFFFALVLLEIGGFDGKPHETPPID